MLCGHLGNPVIPLRMPLWGWRPFILFIEWRRSRAGTGRGWARGLASTGNDHICEATLRIVPELGEDIIPAFKWKPQFRSSQCLTRCLINTLSCCLSIRRSNQSSHLCFILCKNIYLWMYDPRWIMLNSSVRGYYYFTSQWLKDDDPRHILLALQASSLVLQANTKCAPALPTLTFWINYFFLSDCGLLSVDASFIFVNRGRGLWVVT